MAYLRWLRKVRRWLKSHICVWVAVCHVGGAGGARQSAEALKKAHRMLDEALRLNPKCAKAYLWRARWHQECGLYAESEKAYKSALRLSPSSTAAATGLGSLYVAIWRPDEALRVFDQVLDREPDNAVAHYYMGVIKDARGERAEAVAAFERALDSKPRDLRTLVALGYEYCKLQRWEDAARIFDRVCKLRPDSPSGQLGLAYMYIGQGKTAEASNGVDAALRLAGDTREFVLHAARLYLHCGRCDDAERLSQAALSEDRTDPKIWETVALVACHRERFAEATECFNRALELRPGTPFYLGCLADCYDALGEPEKAVEFALKLVDAAPRHRDAYRLLGRLWLNMGHQEQALQALEKAKALGADDAELLDTIESLTTELGGNGGYRA